VLKKSRWRDPDHGNERREEKFEKNFINELASDLPQMKACREKRF
jgi:hypothetical protein